MRGRGQAAAAAVLLAIIAGSIVLFLLVMDPEEREVLLGDETLSSGTESTSTSTDYLLQEYPGRIEDLQQSEIEHKLPSMHLVVLDQGVILDERISLSTKHSLFNELISNYSVETSNYALLDSLQLGFNVLDGKGQLSTYFNDQLVYQGEVEAGQTPVLSIPSNLIHSTNTLVFKSDSPGLAFWSTNYVELSDVKLVAQETDYGKSSAELTIIMSESELENIESASLKFQADCKDDSGSLTVLLNAMTLFSGSPDCNIAFTPIEVDTTQLVIGTNTLEFSIDSGDYTLSHAEFVSDLKEVVYPTYYFQLDDETYSTVDSGEQYTKLYIEFTDSTSLKQGTVYINGYPRQFDTREQSYSLDISSEIDVGNNALQLIPDTVINVGELRVELQ